MGTLKNDRKLKQRLQREQAISGVALLPEPRKLCRDHIGPFGPTVVGVALDAAASVKAEWLPEA